MTTIRRAPDPAHILKYEAQALITAVGTGDHDRTAEILATIAEITHRMQLGLDRELVSTRCPADWTHNGDYVYPVHVSSPQVETPASTPDGPLDLDPIRARLTAATSGPWARGTDELTVTAGAWPIAIVGVGYDDVTVDYEEDTVAFNHVNHSADADLILISHAPEDIENLLNEVDRLNTEQERIMRISQPDSSTDRIEIRLTGLDKGRDADLYLSIRNSGRGRSLDELSTLTPPAGSATTIAAARWAAKQQETHPERVSYKDGVIVIDVRGEDFVGSETVEWGMLNKILKEAIVEVVRERPSPAAAGMQPIQSLKEKAARTQLATYVQK